MKILLISLCSVILTSCQKQEHIKKEPIMTKSQMPKKVEEKETPVVPKGLKTTTLKEAPTNAKTPKTGNMVKVHYTGWLAEEDGSKGRKFDSSVERGEPLEFALGLGQVIKGFDAGILLMKLGEKRELVISPELGYGSKGIGLFIPPNSTLIFDVELVDIA